MIYSITGEIIKKFPNKIIIQQGGFAIEIIISRPTYEELPDPGDECFLYTYLHVREDILMLYGFANLQEKELFLKLIGLSGIGPKNALNILSGVSVNDFKKFILDSDVKSLKRLPGIGEKTARRIIIELKDKFTEKELSELTGNAIISEKYKSLTKESMMALESLGFKRTNIHEIVNKLIQENPKITIEEIVKVSLKKLSKF